MKTRWLMISLFALFFLSYVNSEQAQSVQDRLIAGDHLTDLLDALNTRVVTINNKELRANIEKHKLSAILLPATQPAGDSRNIKRCFAEKTAFDQPDLAVIKDDYYALWNYAVNDAYATAYMIKDSMLSGNTTSIQSEVKELDKQVNSLPQSSRMASRRFVGSILAKAEPTQPELVAYVDDFKGYVKNQTLELLNSRTVVISLTDWQPYAVGSTVLTAYDLGKINPAEVEAFAINKQHYRAVWIGGTYIFAPQAAKPLSWRDPTGLGISKEWTAATVSGAAAKLVPHFVY